MSYDIWLEIDTGGTKRAQIVGADHWNYTSNCSPMWRLAGADLASFDGQTAGECLPILTGAISAMESDPEKFEALNPPNGWGSYESLIPALRELAGMLERHPLATVVVSR